MNWFCAVSWKKIWKMVGNFVKVCRRGLKVNAGKNRVIVLNGEEGLKYEVHVD